MKVFAVIRIDTIDYTEETTAVFANESDAIKDAASKNGGNYDVWSEYRVQPWEVK